MEGVPPALRAEVETENFLREDVPQQYANRWAGSMCWGSGKYGLLVLGDPHQAACGRQHLGYKGTKAGQAFEEALAFVLSCVHATCPAGGHS